MKIIAECAINWDTLEEAKLMISKCKDLGLFAAKFQLYNEESLEGIEDPKVKEYCLKRMLSFGQAHELFNYGKSIGQEVFFTPSFEKAVDWCEEIGVNYYKIRLNLSFIMVVTKMCTRCGCNVSIHEFMKGSKQSDGMHRYCKMCRESMPYRPEG